MTKFYRHLTREKYVFEGSGITTHRFTLSDHAMQGDNITMIELSHDGCLLEKLHSVFPTCFFFQCLNCHI